EDRTLLSTIQLTNGALAYAPDFGVVNTALTLSHNAATHRYTFVDTAEVIVLLGNFISPTGNLSHTVSFGDGNISSIAVNLVGNHSNTVNIEQTLAAAPVTVHLGNGHDTVNVSPSAQNLNTIQGAIAIHGGLGNDRLNVYDNSNGAAQTFSLGAGS